MSIKSGLFILMFALVSVKAQAYPNCEPTDGVCWAKTAVTFGGNEIVSITVLKDFDPGNDWKEIQTSEGICIVGGHKLTVGMSTANWKYETYLKGWTANDGPYDADFGVTLKKANPDGTDSWFSIHCTSYKHWVQPEEFQEAMAGILELRFKNSN